jgi:type IV pilus assembly protein PilA
MTTFCPGCGNGMTEGDQFCRNCGRSATGTSAIADPAFGPLSGKTSGKAIASLVFGLFLFFFPFSIVAIFFGHFALSEIRKSAGRLKGHGIAVAGLVLGYAGVVMIPLILIIAAIAIPNLLRARISANEASAAASVRTLNMAEVSYAQTHPQEGYACSLSALGETGLIAKTLVNGQKNGYAFEISGCGVQQEGTANTRYQIVAYPLRDKQTGVRAFCSDQSLLIRVDLEGSPQNCLEHGTELR